MSGVGRPGDGGVSVLLTRGAATGESLTAALGESRVGTLRELMRRRARDWARAVCPGSPVQEVDGGIGEAVTAPVADVPGGATDDAGGAPATLVIAPELAVWRPEAGAAALEDLAAGCDLSFGPVFDGGLYLLAISAAARGRLAGAPPTRLGGPEAMATLMRLATEAGLELGLVRSERGLRHADDLRALLVDPLTDDELRAALE